MAYRIERVSPSALSATEHCPRFRPDGKENQAAVDGTLFHSIMEELASMPRDQWDQFVELKDMSPDLRRLVQEAVQVLSGIVGEQMQVYKDYRLRPIKGQPRKSPLRPGLYPECEVDRGGGRHGYIDLMVVTAEGAVFILDYKTNRVEKDFSLQLAAYACDVNRLCPAHKFIVCQIIAPRLEDDAQLRLELTEADFAEWNKRIAAIEERASRSNNDPSISGCPGEYCQYCHWNDGEAGVGMCPYMASQTVAVAKFAAPTVFSSDAIPTVDTMRKPLELLPIEQVGLCRELISVLEAYIKARKDEYKVWSETHPGVNPPGWKVVVARGPSKIDTSRQQEIRDKLKSTFGFTDEELDKHMSAVDLKMVAEFLITSCGHPKSKAPDAVKKALEPFMVSGAAVVRWTKAVRKQTATGSTEL